MLRPTRETKPVTNVSTFREFHRDTDRPVICDDLIDALDHGLDAALLSDADCALLADFTLPYLVAQAECRA